jgi:hypothetical protein
MGRELSAPAPSNSFLSPFSSLLLRPPGIRGTTSLQEFFAFHGSPITNHQSRFSTYTLPQICHTSSTSLFSTSSELPNLQALCFDIHTTVRGVYPSHIPPCTLLCKFAPLFSITSTMLLLQSLSVHAFALLPGVCSPCRLSPCPIRGVRLLCAILHGAASAPAQGGTA